MYYFSMSISKEKKFNLSDSEVAILRGFVDREVENIKMFGPADDLYQSSIDSLKSKFA